MTDYQQNFADCSVLHLHVFTTKYEYRNKCSTNKPKTISMFMNIDLYNGGKSTLNYKVNGE